MLYRLLLYRSIARFPDLDSTDLALVREALRFNTLRGVTGFLWRADGQFFQALHGPRAVIGALKAKIRKDERQSEIEVLIDEAAGPVSQFIGWTLGYDHFLGVDLGVQLGSDGRRPALDRAAARRVLDAMIISAEEVRRFGSACPFARVPGEADDGYLERIGEMA